MRLAIDGSVGPLGREVWSGENWAVSTLISCSGGAIGVSIDRYEESCRELQFGLSMVTEEVDVGERESFRRRGVAGTFHTSCSR